MLNLLMPKDTAPLEACVNTPQRCVLAVIIGVEGPSYRPLGAMMTILENGDVVGTLSSGCIEADIKAHALDCLASGATSTVIYGSGSPYIDIKLPCGGGLQIVLIPQPDREVLDELHNSVSIERVTRTLYIHTTTGEVSLHPFGSEVESEVVFQTTIRPEMRFFAFGKGPEVTTFAALTHSASYETTVLSPDRSTLDAADTLGCKAIELISFAMPMDLRVDARTAIILFFHDHDWEPPILQDALKTPAFYIGAQGSMRARNNRLIALSDLGVSTEEQSRLRGPIGLIASARDARTLAISVLAEIVSVGVEESI